MAKNGGDLKDFIGYLHLWYETYHKIIVYIGTIAVSVLFFTVTFLLKDLLTGTYRNKLRLQDIVYLKRSMVLLGTSLFFVFINFLATYNWFVSGIDRAIKQSNVDFGALGDQFKYRRHMGSMGLWGTISLISGWLAGVALFAGIVVYVVGAWGIVTLLLKLE